MLARRTSRFDARELLHHMIGSNWEVSERERVSLDRLSYPWEENGDFEQSTGGIWIPNMAKGES